MRLKNIGKYLQLNSILIKKRINYINGSKVLVRIINSKSTDVFAYNINKHKHPKIDPATKKVVVLKLLLNIIYCTYVGDKP